MKRRNILKGLTLLPLTGMLAPIKSLFAGTKVDKINPLTVSSELGMAPSIFETIGVEPIINCRGTFTIIGGSIERPEVRAAMEAASKNFV